MNENKKNKTSESTEGFRQGKNVPPKASGRGAGWQANKPGKSGRSVSLGKTFFDPRKGTQKSETERSKTYSDAAPSKPDRQDIAPKGQNHAGRTLPKNERTSVSFRTNIPKRDSARVGSDARTIALKALYDVYFLNAYSNLALDRQLKQNNLSPEDRRLATTIFYHCVENRMKIAYLLAPFIKQEPEQIITCILHIAAAQILFLDRVPAFAAVNEAVKEARFYKRDEASGFVNVVLRNLIRAKETDEIHLPSYEDDPEKYLQIEYSASADTVKTLVEAYGLEETEKILSYKPDERLETIRPNLLRYSDGELESYLDAQNIEYKKGAVSHAYCVKNAGNLAESELYAKGLISIQGVSAMLAAMALEPKRGMTILDCCAAPGGKAAFACELMQGSGRVYAWDLHDHRVEMMKNNGKRLGLDNLRCAVRDACILKEDMVQAMDAVIIDAPCSGLGVLSDKPDIKYHFTLAKLKDICLTQTKLLDTCCEYVKVGGRLVYSTCTVLPQENREQISAFLIRHPEFRLDPDMSYLPEGFRSKCEEGMLSLFEHRDGVEGFFIARMIRVL